MRSNGYHRVVPRDLFNESKLLKCLGQLVIEGGKWPNPGVEIEHDGAAFDIRQDLADGSIYVANIGVMIEGEPFAAWTGLNAREPYPLYVSCLTKCRDDVLAVFDDNGKMTVDFLRAILRITNGGETE